MNNFFLIVALSMALLNAHAQSEHKNQLTLQDVIDLSKERSIRAKQAETRKENMYWAYRQFRAGYNPSLDLGGNLPGFRREFFGNTQDDGTIRYQSREQVSSNLNLGLNQPIAWTGGNLSVNTSLNQFGNLSGGGFIDQYQTTLFNVRLDQPIFGFNNLKWDKRIEPLRYEESKRSYVESMEQVAREATTRYFNYLDAQMNIQIAEFNKSNNEITYKIQQGRYNIGKISKDDLLQVELQLLRAERGIVQANLDLQKARLALRSFIGLGETSDLPIELVPPQELPEFEVPLEKALNYASLYRADYLQFQRQRIEANRDVAQAKSQRFQTNLNASFGLNQAASNLPDSYVDPNNSQVVNINLSMPIVDWGRSKARIQRAKANQRLTEYTLDQEIQNFEQEIITLVGQIEVLRVNVRISKKSDEIARERYEVTKSRYLADKETITNFNIAQDEKDRARREYINALRDFWDGYFQLRQLTLYDFLNDELLYTEND